ncbi:phosphonate C-P lyase system protein PhnH [Cohaesibacter celericrescens]|uniref:phosphonate C-P lyase system protein PhnH n=1 Tax=Cohaesibacter celericrescens TaxID=2067669 RepID=UPI001FDFF061|nr:phosphonate C-P lyase system protein PhnH [Cohaesibacter celericrescens]
MQPSSKTPMFSEPNFEAMQGGLGNPVMQSQAIFRAIMDAMARPGTIIPVQTDARPPASLIPLSGAIIATLADADTPLWLDRKLADDKTLIEWLTFHVGAPLAVEPSQATFSVFSSGADLLPLEVFAKGSQDYPDRSTTLIIQVEKLSNQRLWSLSGPGIKDSNDFAVEPISPLFASQWADNNDLYPRGVDVIVVAPDAIACLPRTTKITVLDPKPLSKPASKPEER